MPLVPDFEFGDRVGEVGATADADVVLDEGERAPLFDDDEIAGMVGDGIRGHAADEHDLERLREPDTAADANDEAVFHQRGVQRQQRLTLVGGDAPETALDRRRGCVQRTGQAPDGHFRRHISDQPQVRSGAAVHEDQAEPGKFGRRTMTE